MRNGKKENFAAAGALLLVLAVITVVLLIFGAVYLINQRNALKEPDIEDITDNEIGSDFVDLIQEADKNAEFIDIALPELSPEEILSKYEIRETYYQECIVSHGSGENAYSKTLHILRDGKCWNIRTYEKDKLTETLICDGTTIYIRNEITGKSTKYSVSDKNTPEAFASLPDHNRIVSLANDYRNHSNDNTSTLSKCSYSFYRTSDLNMLLLVLNYRETGLTERYYYYLDYGMIYHCESGVSGTSTYTMTTTVFTPDITNFLTNTSFTVPK